MRFMKFALHSVLFVSLATGLLNLSLAQSAGIPPKLPAEWNAANSQKMTLVDFYSDYCGACQMMAPYLKRLEVMHSKQLSIKHINAEKPDSPKTVAKYHITGTPTYILYNATGEPIYQMTELISPSILQGQVRRAIGQLKHLDLPPDAPLPKPLAGHEKSWGNLILLAFEHPAECPTCISNRPQLEAMAQAGEKTGFKLIYLDTSNLPAWAESIRPKELPTYILLDNALAETHAPSADHGILINVNGSVSPSILWQSIQLFGKTGVERAYP